MKFRILHTLAHCCLLFAPLSWATPFTTESEPCHQAAISSSQPQATEIGLDILAKGGNAIDAAVAMGYALAVVEPSSGNLGGGGFMMLHLAGDPAQSLALNFREKAPAKLEQRHFWDKQGQFQNEKTQSGYLAVGVPGTVMGLNTALERFGSLPLKTVITPAIKLANQGFFLHDTHARFLQTAENALTAEANTKAIFTRHGETLKMGDRLTQHQLANTLTKIMKGGSDAFYHGDIAKEIVNASKQHGGVLSMNDFTQYTVTWEQPIRCHYHGYEVVTAPPPSSGGVALCEMLKILEQNELTCHDCPQATRDHLLIEAMRYSFADRNNSLGDPAFIDNPIATLLSPEHIHAIKKQIQRKHATPSALICPSVKKSKAPESANTTHYSVVDKHGNAVSVTYSLNSYYGAKVIAGDTGFLLNNHINDFSFPSSQANIYQLQQNVPNQLQGNKRPLSSMTPTILLRDGQLQMVLGTPGGPTIITTLLQVLVHHLDQKLPLQTAIDKARFHMQCQPNTVYTEEGAFSATVAAALKDMGHSLTPGSIYHTREWGAVAAIETIVQGNKQCRRALIDKRRPHGLAKGQ